MNALLLAVDVGSTSARAGVFDAAGSEIAAGTASLAVLRPRDDHAVYRMADIWAAACIAMRRALQGGGGLGDRIAGIAFSATTGLVLQHDGAPPLEGGADVFGAMDMRAVAEAEHITRGGDAWLDHMGGSVSAQNPLPRLMWLKRHDPMAWQRVTAVLDLCDELVLRASGDDRHSLSALAAQWPYDAGKDDPWRYGLLAELDLAEVWSMGALSGDHVRPGEMQGRLLSSVAGELGLQPGIPVGGGLLDRHAALFGAMGRNMRGRSDGTATLVGGFATSLMMLSGELHYVPGVDGPSRDAVLPGLWTYEARQPYTGAALDDVLTGHPSGPGLASAAEHDLAAGEVLDVLAREGPGFASGRHILPDWFGNRTPQDDRSLRALDLGADDGHSRRSFLETYYATARAIALQMRHIVSHLNAHEFAIDRICLAGAHSRNKLLGRLYQDALGVDLVVPGGADPVLLGTAMAAAAAAGIYPDIAAAVDVMAPPQARLQADSTWRRAHDAAYRIYGQMVAFRGDIARQSEALAALRTA